jgi:hypothetical protein
VRDPRDRELNGTGRNETSYHDPAKGNCQLTWSGSLELVGRPLEQIQAALSGLRNSHRMVFWIKRDDLFGAYDQGWYLNLLFCDASKWFLAQSILYFCKLLIPKMLKAGAGRGVEP